MFFALLIADLIALVMLALKVKQLKIVLIVGVIVFVVLAAVLFFNNRSREKSKKREAQAAAKIADLQDQVEVALNSKNTPTNVTSVH